MKYSKVDVNEMFVIIIIYPLEMSKKTTKTQVIRLTRGLGASQVKLSDLLDETANFTHQA